MALGIIWSVLEPLALLLIMTAVFGFILKAPTNGYPYPVFAFAGLIPWLLFSKATLSAAGSLQENMGVISKIYFPRLILPLSAVFREAYDTGVTLVILVALAATYGFLPSWKLLLWPLLIVFTLAAALAIGLWVAALLVKFRDFRPLLTVALQLGMYATPIIYSASVVPESVIPYYQLNPMYWTVEASRWIMLDQPFVTSPSLYLSVLLTVLLFASGLLVFSIYERATVDVQ